MEDKLWRFNSYIIFNRTPTLELTDFRFTNPVPVKYDGKVVGFACLHDEKIAAGGVYWGEFAIDYALPVRLDVENGEKYFTLPHATLREWVQIARAGSTDAAKLMPMIGDIDYIEIRKDCDDKQMPAIGEWL